MEKPSWAFNNKTYFNIVINNVNTKCFLFSDFEHNWDLFQFLTNDNIYYFCLNKNIKTEYNFDFIYKTYLQKCKHINKENMYFILFFPEQEKFIQKYPELSNYLFDKDIIKFLNIEQTLITQFNTYLYNDAICLINNKNNLSIDEDELTSFIKKNIFKRCYYNKSQFNNITFFGASVTEQKYSYVNYLMKKYKESSIYKKGYSGCHINHALWLVDDVINNTPKFSVCFLEWITSIYRPNKEDLKCFLTIILQKLIQNDITPIFLYLYKSDIDNYMDMIDIYEEIANNYNISSIHFYKVFKEMKNIDLSLLFKDNCHTVYDGSNLYGKMLDLSIFMCLLNEKYFVKQSIQNTLKIKDDIMNKYKNISVLSLDKILDCSNMDIELFNEKKYYKISNEIIFNIEKKYKNVIALNILYYKNNGYVFINNHKLLTWDAHCFYKRYGYINLNINFDENIKITISQENVDTSTCKYDNLFPNEKYLLLAEIIVC